MNIYRVRFHDVEITNSVRINAEGFYLLEERVHFCIAGEIVAAFQLSRCDFWREMPGEPRFTTPTLAWQPEEEFEE